MHRYNLPPSHPEQAEPGLQTLLSLAPSLWQSRGLSVLFLIPQQRRRSPRVILAVKNPQVGVCCKDSCVDMVYASAAQEPQRLHAIQGSKPPARCSQALMFNYMCGP